MQIEINKHKVVKNIRKITQRLSFRNNFVLSIFKPWLIVTGIVLILLLKGSTGNGLDQAGENTRLGQAFESSITRARYGLVLSMVENHSFVLSPDIANFAAPDAAVSRFGVISIFPPGVALYALPFYIAGRVVNLGQIAVSLGIGLVTMLNCTLLYLISKKIGLSRYKSTISPLVFLFASNALVYATSVAQHQLSTLLLLINILIVLGQKSLLKHLIFWFVYGMGIVVDLPNAVLFLPVAVYMVVMDLFSVEIKNQVASFSLSYKKLLGLLTLIIPLGFYAFYNFETSGNIVKIGQFLPRYSLGVDAERALVTDGGQVDVLGPFSIGRVIDGLKVLLFGFERSILFYAPVFYFGLVGFAGLVRRDIKYARLFTSIVVINILLYAMFEDVWGGWAFGPRYLIPCFSILSLFVAQAVDLYGKKIVFLLTFIPTLVFSISVNVLGSITTTLIPPVHEAIGLDIDPSLRVAINYLFKSQPESYIYKLAIKGFLSGLGFYFLVFGLVITLFLYYFFKAIYEN